MMMTFIPESLRVAPESFGVVSAVILVVLAAIVITGFWELLIQEIKLKRLEQKRLRHIATNQNSDRDPRRDNGIDISGGRECATKAKSVQSSMRHFARAVERLQTLDSKWMDNGPIIHRVTQDLASDLRGMWSAGDLAKGNVQGTKDLPLLLHGKGSQGKLRRQQGSRRCR